MSRATARARWARVRRAATRRWIAGAAAAAWFAAAAPACLALQDPPMPPPHHDHAAAGQVQALGVDGQPQVPPQAGGITLDDIERRALEHNPALAAADAAVRAAEARRKQAGLWPNPIVGYSGEDLPLDANRQGGKNGFFVAQDVPLGKLGADQRVRARALDQAKLAVEARRLRLLGDVRRLFYRTLAAQRRVEVRQRLVALARDSVAVTGQLFNTGVADAPDRLASENEATMLEASLAAARVDAEELWASLRAVVADPDLAPGELAGDLASGPPALDRDEWHRRLFEQSPELRAAAGRIALAEAALGRARAERLPDLAVEGGLRHDRTPVGPGGPEIGTEAFADIGLRLPLWNRNQGGIAAAEADLAKARLDLESTRLTLDARFASQFGRYRQASLRAAAYRQELLARARSAYDQYLAQYRQMMASYPQVLLAQRTLAQLEDDAVAAGERAWDACIAIQTFQLGAGGGTGAGDGSGGAAETGGDGDWPGAAVDLPPLGSAAGAGLTGAAGMSFELVP